MSFWRRLAWRFRPADLWVVHHPGYRHAPPHVPLDPDRADRIATFLRDQRLVGRTGVVRPRAATLEAILRVHDREYVRSLDRVEVVSQALGVPLTDEERQGVLDAQRLGAGGTIYAARLAWRTGRTALNLSGGFHHATADQGMGFCVINDVAIAVAHLRHYGFAGRILVVDLDLHDGNGTRAIFARDATVHTYSVHNQDWEPAGGVAATAVALGAGVDDETLLRTVEETLPPVVTAHHPELVFYVAGTDPAEDDRLGDWRMTARGMFARDRLVVESLRRYRRGVPLVVVLAGGYGRGAWRYTARFAAWLARGVEVEPPDELEVVLRRAREATLVPDAGGAGGENWGLTAADLFPGAGGGADGRVLDAFSRYAIELSLEQVGFLAAVRQRGFPNPVVSVDTGSGLGQTIRLFADAERRQLLLEVRVNRSKRVVPGMEVLYVEWLRLEDPRREFTPTTPRLPGQEHPGLGLLREIVAWLVRLCETLGLDGMAAQPSQYYMAAVTSRHVRFLDPRAQARFEALRDLLGGMPLAQAEGALAAGRVVDDHGRPVAWEPALQVYPVSRRLQRAMDEARAHPAPRPTLTLLPV